MKPKKYFFNHDSDARNDERILSVRKMHGMEGYGVYWAIVEKLRVAKGYMLETDYSTIAWELHIGEELVRSIVEDYGLFVVSDGHFFSQRLTDDMLKRDEKSEKCRRAGKLGMQSRWDNTENQPLQAPQTELPIQQPTQPTKEPPQPTKTRSKKYSPEETQLHSRCREIFNAFYVKNKGADFYWSAKEMAAIVGIIKQIQFQMQEEDRTNLDMVGANFQIFIQMIYAKADDWIKANISPTLIHSKFNEIYTQLKNSTRNGNKQSNPSSGNARDNADYLASLIADLQSGTNK